MAADDQLADVPFIILANKADRPGAATRDQLLSRFALASTVGPRHHWELHLVAEPLSLASLQPAIDFLLQNMQRL
jgi:hypothetical protein